MRSRTTVPSRFTRIGFWFVLALIVLIQGRPAIAQPDCGRTFGHPVAKCGAASDQSTGRDLIEKYMNYRRLMEHST